MNTDTTPPATGSPQHLEQALAAANADATNPQRGVDVLLAYATGRVAVVLDRPWEGSGSGTAPSPDTRFLMVSDGPDTEKPMMAVFSSLDRARRCLDELPDHGDFDYPVEVHGGWSLLGLPEGAGVFINPNQQPAYRISAETAVQMRADVKAALDKAIARRQDETGEGA